MHFVRFIANGESGEARIRLGILCDGGVLDLQRAGFDFPNMVTLIKATNDGKLSTMQQAVDKARKDSELLPLERVRLLSPIERPTHDILCVGVNYSDHREEMKHAEPNRPTAQSTVFFSKRVHTLTGPDEAIISCPDLDAALDYEVELAVIIGREGKNITAEDAEKHIFGYSVFNDVTARTLQQRHGQWFKGKSLDGFSVLGPSIVHKSALPLPLDLKVTSIVNGEVRQSSNTTLMMSSIPKIITELSEGMTLEVGDIIATGTPSGVGMGFTPPRLLKRGDVVECFIEHVGTLRNTIE